MKKKKRHLNKKGLIFIVLSIYLIVMFILYIYNLPIKNVIIIGNNTASNKDIKIASKIDDYNKLITLDKKKIINNIKSIKTIKNVKIKKKLNGNVIINIEEQNVLFFYALDNTYILENNTKSSSDLKYLGIPVLINYTPSEILTNFTKKLVKIDIEIVSKISEIEYNPDIKNEKVIDDKRFLLRMNDGNQIYINLANMQNLNKYDEIYSTLTDKGILYLDSSSKGVVFQTYDFLKKKEDEKNELSE